MTVFSDETGRDEIQRVLLKLRSAKVKISEFGSRSEDWLYGFEAGCAQYQKLIDAALSAAPVAQEPVAKMTFTRAMDVAERGFEIWKSKPHNAKWFKRIDGTPIPNDLLVNIAEAFCNADR